MNPTQERPHRFRRPTLRRFPSFPVSTISLSLSTAIAAVAPHPGTCRQHLTPARGCLRRIIQVLPVQCMSCSYKVSRDMSFSVLLVTAYERHHLRLCDRITFGLARLRYRGSDIHPGLAMRRAVSQILRETATSIHAGSSDGAATVTRLQSLRRWKRLSLGIMSAKSIDEQAGESGHRDRATGTVVAVFKLAAPFGDPASFPASPVLTRRRRYPGRTGRPGR